MKEQYYYIIKIGDEYIRMNYGGGIPCIGIPCVNYNSIFEASRFNNEIGVAEALKYTENFRPEEDRKLIKVKLEIGEEILLYKNENGNYN